jgi:peptide/nickel transport system permease protein
MKYLLSRTGYLLTLWLGVVAATFLLFHVVPTDPARTILGPNADEHQVEALRKDLGLDQPVAVQLGRYIRRVVALEFAESYVDRRPVGPEVFRRLGLTVLLAALASIIALGYVCVVALLEMRGRWRNLTVVADFLFLALPTLFSAVLVALLTVAYFPFTRFSGWIVTAGDLLFLVPPAVVLALYPMGVLGRIAKHQIRSIAKSDFVRAARARGTSELTIVRSYMLRNSLVSLLAAFGNQLPLLLTSTFIVEIVFSVPGIGTLILKSVLERDLPMLEGIVVATSLLTILINLVLELIYPFVDPRIGAKRVV